MNILLWRQAFVQLRFHLKFSERESEWETSACVHVPQPPPLLPPTHTHTEIFVKFVCTCNVVCFLLGKYLASEYYMPTFWNTLFVPSSWVGRYLPAYEDGTGCSETSACKIQTPGNYPEESIQHSELGEILKSRILIMLFYLLLVASALYDWWLVLHLCT